jgi:CheY-like chemotaxis protein
MANGNSGSCILEHPPAEELKNSQHRSVTIMLGSLANPIRGAAASWIPPRIIPTGTPLATANTILPETVVSTVIGYPARLLLVEDNPINQKVATLMLKHLGYNADIAQNGAEAVEAVARHTYDLILMDCLMPEMDGLEATRIIRARTDYGSRVPIVAMTANAFAEDRRACLEAGMSDYLPKPVREAELAAKLNQWLNGR